jgi:hypothetical protein
MTSSITIFSFCFPIPQVKRCSYSYCESLSLNDTWMAGNVVLCFTSDQSAVEDAAWSVKEIGCLGLIIAKNPSKSLYSCNDDFPCVQVSYEIGTQILYYIRSTRYCHCLAIKEIIITIVDVKFIHDINVAGIHWSGLGLPKHILEDLCQPKWHTSHLEGLVPSAQQY